MNMQIAFLILFEFSAKFILKLNPLLKTLRKRICKIDFLGHFLFSGFSAERK